MIVVMTMIMLTTVMVKMVVTLMTKMEHNPAVQDIEAMNTIFLQPSLHDSHHLSTFNLGGLRTSPESCKQLKHLSQMTFFPMEPNNHPTLMGWCINTKYLIERHVCLYILHFWNQLKQHQPSWLTDRRSHTYLYSKPNSPLCNKKHNKFVFTFKGKIWK